MSILKTIKDRYASSATETLSLEEFLDRAKSDKSLYATSAERLLKAIGEPVTVDTVKDPRLSRIFQNRTIKIYPAFSHLFGMEEVVEQLVGFLKHSAQGLEESKQILYLLGPVGGGKSTLAETIKDLVQKEPIYVLKAGDQVSPIWESPLNLFTKEDSAALGIPPQYLNKHPSPWAIKRLAEFGGDASKFEVVKLHPSKIYQIAISKTEPGDENNQDISNLVGKLDIRRVAKFKQNDADAYNFSGGLNLANQGVLEFVEMFKAPLKMLHPLLTATQEGSYNGTEAVGGIPFSGLILAHSNETEWASFKSKPQNEAFIDRIYTIKVPYVLRVSEETKIYEKLISSSQLASAACAPFTLKMLAEFIVLSRLTETPNVKTLTKLKVYDGENMKEKDNQAKSYVAYKDLAGVTEGMSGLSTRFAFKILSKTFNHDSEEVAANPIHLFDVLLKQLENEQLPNEELDKYKAFIANHLEPTFYEAIRKELNEALLESYDEFGQNTAENYVIKADFWTRDEDFCDPETGAIYNRDALNTSLTEIEKVAEISNPKDFRHEIVSFWLRSKANNQGKTPDWKSYRKLKEVIEKKIFDNMEDLLPIITFASKGNKEDEAKHQKFVARMMEKGYTKKQIKIITDRYLQRKKV
jgi:serine protein kinase